MSSKLAPLWLAIPGLVLLAPGAFWYWTSTGMTSDDLAARFNPSSKLVPLP